MFNDKNGEGSYGKFTNVNGVLEESVRAAAGFYCNLNGMKTSEKKLERAPSENSTHDENREKK